MIGGAINNESDRLQVGQFETGIAGVSQESVCFGGKFSNVSLGFWIESQPWSDNVLRFVFRDANTLAHDTVQIREVLIRIFVVTELTSLGVEGHFFA
jgi:hypothetical protein